MLLADYRSLMRVELRDAGSAVWTDSQLDQAVREALDAYSRVMPRSLIGTITVGAAARELSLTSLGGLLEVTEVWLPYTVAQPEDPPNRRVFRRLTASTLSIEDGEAPGVGEVARVFYTGLQTINGLDSATDTTVLASHERGLAAGAAALAALARARQLAETENISPSARRWSQDWANQRLREWRAWLASVALTHSGPVAWENC